MDKVRLLDGSFRIEWERELAKIKIILLWAYIGLSVFGLFACYCLTWIAVALEKIANR